MFSLVLSVAAAAVGEDRVEGFQRPRVETADGPGHGATQRGSVLTGTTGLVARHRRCSSVLEPDVSGPVALTSTSVLIFWIVPVPERDSDHAAGIGHLG
ncbi:hypothetical protein [Streptoalloteichus tenebrarius]|uniref:hypothetical protein n=1 Tax=Streptoalloteichus tenebrarius (strain ATCC 17920 / DSM 40477 / JCM 4838 / CBS 697.72 / NBRC 16177 / NCIMB 11028 / NRRL B-12390 / A12253. 1 / ISP 5477) TaxID=1933 RepID=UPI0035E7E9FA